MKKKGDQILMERGSKYVDIDLAKHLMVDKVQCLCHPLWPGSALHMHYPKCVQTTYQKLTNSVKKQSSKAEIFNWDREKGLGPKYELKETTVH